ncbi:uncharacterized protein LOC144732790 isoform X2 [Lampetra planeri]
MTPSERTEGRVVSLFCIAALLSATAAVQLCQGDHTPVSATLGGSVAFPANRSIDEIDQVHLVYIETGKEFVVFSWDKNENISSRGDRQKYAFENATLHILNIAANDTGVYEFVVDVLLNDDIHKHRRCFRLSIAGGNVSRTMKLAFISVGVVVCVLVMSAAGVALYKSSRPGCKITSQAVEDDVDLDTVYSTINDAMTVEHIEIKEFYSEVFQAKTKSPYEYAHVDGDVIRNAPPVNSAAAFKVQYILVEALALLLRVRSHVLLECIKMSIKDVDFEGHHSHQSLNQLHIVFELVIAQEATKHCDKAVPSRFLLTSELLGEFMALQDLLYLWSDEDTGFDLCLSQLREEVLKVLEGCRLLIFGYCIKACDWFQALRLGVMARLLCMTI